VEETGVSEQKHNRPTASHVLMYIYPYPVLLILHHQYIKCSDALLNNL